MREVKRRAKVGEKIKIVNAWVAFENYKNGDVLTVRISNDGNAYQNGHVFVRDCEIGIMDTEYVVLEEEEKMRFKVGDRVRVKKDLSTRTGNVNGEMVELAGKTGKVVIDDGTNCYPYKIDIDDREWSWDDAMLEPAPFTKADLKPCMVVKHRSGNIAIVAMSQDDGVVLNFKDGLWGSLKVYSDNLESSTSEERDIMEVYGFSKSPFRANEISTNNRELLFKREEPKPKRKMTVSEICKELGEEIEIVKGE